MPLPVEVIEDEWHGIRAPSTDLPDSNYSKGLLFLIFTACFVSRRIHVEGEEARRLTVKMVQKFLGESVGGRGSCGVSWCPHWLRGSIWWRCSFLLKQFSSVHSFSRLRLFVNPWTTARQASLSIPNCQSWLKLMSIKLVMPPSHLILCHPLLPSIFPSIRVFSNESVLHIRWPKYWSFSFNISPSKEHSGLISFKMDWSKGPKSCCPLLDNKRDPCCPRDPQESSPTPQFKSINSSAFSFLYGPTPTSTHDHWKNYSVH